MTRSSGSAGRREAEAASGSLPAAVARAREDPAILNDLREIYALADADAARSAAVCLGGGACCKFHLARYRLHLTTAELALLVAEPPPAPRPCRSGRCPYQVGPRCMARDRRPLGCRMFFCRAPAPDRLNPGYERHHRAIRRLHRTHDVPYLYPELTAALAELSWA